MMKRLDQDVVGRPKARDARRDVAGGRMSTAFSPPGSPMTMATPLKPAARGVPDVASYRHALDDPMGTGAVDGELLEEFADFMTCDDDFGHATPPAPDPEFRERLRKRLWRAYVLTHLRGRGDRH